MLLGGESLAGRLGEAVLSLFFGLAQLAQAGFVAKSKQAVYYSLWRDRSPD